jgi:hypothetical protein
VANGHLEPGEAHAFEFCRWLDREGLKITAKRADGDLSPTLVYVDQGAVVSAMNLAKVMLRISQDEKLTKEQIAALRTVSLLLENL